MEGDNTIPVLLLTGYLGSGKTTLVNNILRNQQGLKFAVIVNDIGEVNIDATLIQRQGLVDMNNDTVIPLQNGCICCTLRTDLIEQIFEIMKMQRFDYILIEASGICDPAPIAQTIAEIPHIGGAYTKYGICKLYNTVTIVDALRMAREFKCGEGLRRPTLGEDDIENLLIQQIEFCNLIILNKVSEVSADELARIKGIIHALQPVAKIMECDYARVDIDQLVNSPGFDFGRVAASAGWVQELGKQCEVHDEHHHHEDGHECHDPHCHCHHHHHEDGEAGEYGISTFVYYTRKPFDMNFFDYFISNKWPKGVIRTKGVCYFKDEPDMSYLFEQAGTQISLQQAGQWYAALSEEELVPILQREPDLLRDWDETYGDRMQKIVFIGQGMDKEEIVRELDMCCGELSARG